MSTVAWDGKTLAADRQATNQGTMRPATKIRKLESGEVMAITGNYGAGLIMMKWYEDGADLAKYPAFQADKEEWCRLIVARPDGTVLEYERQPIGMVFPDTRKAWGSGMDFALGALCHGANAIEAILIASGLDESTGIGVDSFQVVHHAVAPR